MATGFDTSPPTLLDGPGVFFDLGPAPGGGRKGMIQLALKLTRITFAALKTLAGTIKTGITGNANFPTPDPSPTDVQDAIDGLEEAQTELGVAEATVLTKAEAVEARAEELRNVLRAVGAACLNAVKDDPEELAKTKLMSANLPIKAEGAPVDEIERPENFHVSQGDHSGEIDGGCDRVRHARMYRVRCGATANGPFTTVYEGTKSSFTIANQPIGECFLQMAAFGTNGGWSEWSDIARIHVV